MTYPSLPGKSARPRSGFLRRLGPGQRVAVLVAGGAVTLAVLCCGGLTALGALVGGPQQTRTAADERPVAQPVAPPPAPPGPEATPTAPPTAASPSPTPSPTVAPVRVETRTVTKTRAIPFHTRTVRDGSLPAGVRKVRTRGVAGIETLTYRVTLTNGTETGRTLLRRAVTRRPVTQVVAVGTKEAARCDPNYSGCVPIASDVDCAGGSGNGPAYVTGPVRVIGSDIYDLDRDGDGYGCD
jgi:resuscitation-promoting factor RpfB